MRKLSRTRRVASTTLVIVGALTLAACSSGSSKSSTTAASPNSSAPAATGDPLAAANALVTLATAPITQFGGPTTPTKATPGKRVAVVDAISAAEGLQVFHAGFDPAAKALGWIATTIDGKGTPQGFASGIEQALTQHADAVVLVAIAPSTVINQLKELKAAKIPVIAFSNFEEPHDGLWLANVGYNPPTESKYLAAFVAKDSGGKANIAVINDPEFSTVAERAKEFKAQLPLLCPDCKISNTTDFQVTELGTQLGPKVKAVLQANPDVNYIWAPYDGAVPPMITAIQQAGLTGKVKLVSYGGIALALKYLRDKNTMVGTIANATEWQGYEAADTMQRILNGEQPDPNGLHSDPIKLLTQDNVPSGPFTGDFDFATAYKKLWGVS